MPGTFGKIGVHATNCCLRMNQRITGCKNCHVKKLEWTNAQEVNSEPKGVELEMSYIVLCDWLSQKDMISIPALSKQIS